MEHLITYQCLFWKLRWLLPLLFPFNQFTDKYTCAWMLQASAYGCGGAHIALIMFYYFSYVSGVNKEPYTHC